MAMPTIAKRLVTLFIMYCIGVVVLCEPSLCSLLKGSNYVIRYQMLYRLHRNMHFLSLENYTVWQSAILE